MMVFVFASCSLFNKNKSDSSKRMQPGELAQQNNKFAFELYQHIYNDFKDKNFVSSPFSISTALAATYTGAREQTRSEMSATLHFPLQEGLFYSYKALMDSLQALNKSDSVKFELANSVWLQKDFYVKDMFAAVLNNYYYSEFHLADFKDQYSRQRTVKQMNKWVKSKTHDHINEIMQTVDINELTRLILLNAIYFKAPWEQKFNRHQTRDKVFYTAPNDSVIAPFMNQKSRFAYYENNKLSAIELSYLNQDFAMLLVMPQKDRQLSYSSLIDTDTYNEINEGLELRQIELSMPKFKVKAKSPLNSALKQMGMLSAFSNEADFSGITGEQNLKIDKVLHKAYLETDESGSEAAAATAVAMTLKSASPVSPFQFTLDHPFIFILKEKKYNGILFLGHIFSPGV
jgi:serpin B